MESTHFKDMAKAFFAAGISFILILMMWITPSMAITWGTEDFNNEYPNVGVMAVFSDEEPVGYCSCTLIDTNVVLTAGHCTDHAQSLLAAEMADYVAVSFDQDPTILSSNWFWVDTIVTHPDFRWGPTSNPNDVGLLILSESVDDIDPATLPDEGFLDLLRAEGMLHKGRNKAQFTVVGYGATLDWPPPEIAHDPKRRIAESEYRALLKVWLRVSQNKATGDAGTCFGDSGGPVFWEDPDTGELTLVGITSWGDPQCISASFNYRTDILEVLDFIQENRAQW